MRFDGNSGEGNRTCQSTAKQGGSCVKAAIDPVVATVFEVRLEDLAAPTRRSARSAFARQVAMYLAHVACGLSLTDVGLLFRRDRTTVAHACTVVEDRRDEASVDLLLDRLEHAVRGLVAALAAVRR